ncbi:Peptide deformylase [Streptococcus sp. HSISM1]|nr:Peptide deformylase [Streptococcus sp. HSISM1]
MSGLYYADFISFYSPTQLCGGGTTKSNSNELPISVPLSFFHFVCYALCILMKCDRTKVDRYHPLEEFESSIVLAVTRIEHALNAV